MLRAIAFGTATGTGSYVKSASPTFTGTITAAALNLSGNFAINTDKFTVAASTGNTVVAGTLTSTGSVAIGTTVAANLRLNISGGALAVSYASPARNILQIDDNNTYGLVVSAGNRTLVGTNTDDGSTQFQVAGTAKFTGLVTTVASATGSAGLRLPHGAAPTSPVNGDMWTTTAGAFIYINGVTKTFTLL